MPIATTLTGLITAIASVLTALGLFTTALTAWHKAQQLAAKIDDVHVIVNQQRTDAQNYQRALILALNDAGVKVPVDQSQQPLGETDGTSS
jgi:hypothetical protein